MVPVRLIPENTTHEIIDVLSGLLDAARGGHINGLVFGVSMRGQRYFCDAAGALHRNPVVGLGVASMLASEMQYRIQKEGLDTVL
jgi:hypothetical protein